MRRIAVVLALVLILGCGRSQTGLPKPGAEKIAPVQPLAPTRVMIDGGFRLGPYSGLEQVRWVTSDQLQVVMGTDVGRVSLSGGLPEIVSLSEEERKAFFGLSTDNESPDRKHVVRYGRIGPGRFLDRSTGQEHTLDVPGFYGSNRFDSWSPDGTQYLVQSKRDDETPGFYFIDADGRLGGRFHERGYYSHRARWAPHAKRLAFLSVPIGTKYPTAPDGWDEQPFGPRVGLLDVASGKAQYVNVGTDQVAYGFPVWSGDGTNVAVTCGDLLIHQLSPASPGWDGKVTTIRNSRICVINTETGTVRRVGAGDAPDVIFESLAWSPDGSTLLVSMWKDQTPGEQYALLHMAGGEQVPLAGKAVWVDGNRLAVVREEGAVQAVQLVDRSGTLIRTLASGIWVREVMVSPDHARVAFILRAQYDATPQAEYLLIFNASP